MTLALWNMKLILETGCKYLRTNNNEAVLILQEDAVESLMKRRLEKRYGAMNTFRQGDKFYSSNVEEEE